jgi:histidyl-tRNA synthetase
VGVPGFNLLLGDLGLAAEFISSLPAPNGVRSHLLQNFWRREAFQHLLKRFAELAPQGKLTDDSVALELARMLSSLGEKASHSLVRQILSLFVEKEIGQRNLDEIAERFLHRFISGENLHLPKESLEAMQEYLSISGEPDTVLHRVEKLMQNIGVLPGQAFENIHRRVELLKKVGSLPSCVQLDLGFRRGIEYYAGFIFEIHCPVLGSVSQVCGGGRYDGLLSALGAHSPIPAVLGIDRLNLALGAASTSLKDGSSALVDAVLATVGQVPEEIAWQIAQICREGGWRVRLEIDHRRLGTILGHASEEKRPFVVIVGEDEIRDHNVRIRDMLLHSEKVVPIDALKQYVQVSIETKNKHEYAVSPRRRSS